MLFAAVAAEKPPAGAHLECTSLLGRKLYSLPDKDGLVAAAEKELRGDQKHPGLWLKLAQAQAAVWQDREAVATLAHALQLAPNNPALYTERGHRELPLRDFDAAETDLKRAVALDGKNVEAHYHLGLAYYFRAEFDKAASAFQNAVDAAPNTDSLINSTNWLYASLRRANKPDEAAKALAKITPEMNNTEPHTAFYLTLVRFFQGKVNESDAVPEPPAPDNTNTETELKFDTIAYGVGNWHLYNGETAKAKEYFERVVKGRVWITWGFVGAEADLAGLRGKRRR